jgi:hypothetical protein
MDKQLYLDFEERYEKLMSQILAILKGVNKCCL